ncbi:MAG: 1,4-dihydroxy-6-naphthoate synthase, partial [Nitrospirae bacterium]|nr:1,4-dihydroxy-6-naphthoate synthase [Nitrospirota bacterium]
CGPLLVARDSEKFIKGTFSGELKIAIPGKLTTAFLLLQLFSSASGIQPSTFVAMPFYEIMEAVRDGRVDAGLLIHESRFTYQDYGLQQITDLGEWWEKETGLPIPLGGIIARESLGTSVIRTIENLIRTGIKYSLSHRDEAMSYIKKHSQELSEDVVMKHIALYVNDYTLDIGDDGLAALDELLKRAAKIFKN